MPTRKKTANRFSALLLAGLLLAGAGCDSGRQPSPREFSVLSWNLHHYGLLDRDRDGQTDDPKPAAEREAVLDTIAAQQPDILLLQEIGNPEIFQAFRQALKQRGLDYPEVEYWQRDRSEHNLAILSRFPVLAVNSHTDETFQVSGKTVPVARGFLDVEYDIDGYRFRVINAHLKSKVFHPLGQSEMRRSEARLLGRIVRDILHMNPDINLLVAGDMNDYFNSDPLDKIRGESRKYLLDVRPADEVGDVWTHFSSYNDSYTRLDYLLVSRALLPEVVPEKTCVLRGPQISAASDHRPLFAVFKKFERRMEVR